MFISLLFVTFLLDLLSAVHCGRLMPSCNYVSVIVLFCLLLFLFSCFLAPWLLPSRCYCFSCLGCRAILRFSLPFLIRHFYCHAIFIAAVHFIAVQPAVSQLFIQGWTLIVRFCSGPAIAIFILLLKTSL